MCRCEIINCNHCCDDGIDYVNKYGISVCGNSDDAISYDEYLEMLKNNPPLMPFDKPNEF